MACENCKDEGWVCEDHKSYNTSTIHRMGYKKLSHLFQQMA